MTTYSVERIFQLPPAASLALGARMVIYDPNDGKDKQIDPTLLVQGLTYDRIDYNPQTTVQQPHKAGRTFYDSDADQIVGYTNDPSVGTTIFGEQLMFTAINEEAFGLVTGNVVKITGLTTNKPSVKGAQANTILDARTTLGMVKAPIASGERGKVGVFDVIAGVDTSGMSVNDIIYLDPDNAMKFTNIEPSAPNYTLAIGFVSVVDAVNGVVGVRFGGYSGSDTEVNIQGALNGIATQEPSVTLVIDGGNVYADVINKKFPTTDLPIMLGSDRYLLNTTTGGGVSGAARVQLSLGTNYANQVKNLIYVRLIGGVPTLEAGTTDPPLPFIRIGSKSLSNITDTTNDGEFTYRRQNNTVDLLNNVNDGAKGIIEDIVSAIRDKLPSNWLGGQDQVATVNNTTIRITFTSGRARQFREQSLLPFDGLTYWIMNNTSNQITYEKVDNLTAITADATGSTLLSNNSFYTIKLYQLLNSEGTPDRIIVTRPTGNYSDADLAISDALKYGVDFNDTDKEDLIYPLCNLVIGRTGGSGATISLVELTDKRTKYNTGGSGGGAAGGAGTDDKVGVTVNDDTPTYLASKAIGTDGIEAEVLNPGGNEQLALSGKNLPFLLWQYNDSVIDEDPGNGKFLIGTNFINISQNQFSNSAGTINKLNTIKNGATIFLSDRDDRTKYASIDVINGAIDNTTYVKIPSSIFDDTPLTLDSICGFDITQAPSVTTEVAAPTIAATVLDIDFDNKNNYETSAETVAIAGFSITISNDSVAINAHIDLFITNSIIITLPVNSLMQDDEDRWTPAPTYQIAVDGLTGNSYELSFRKVGTKLKWILSQKFK